MLEYLIRSSDGDWFDFSRHSYPGVLKPIRTPSRQIEGWGDNRIAVDGEEVAFSYEDPGIQVSFETGRLTEEQADQIVAEVCENIEAMTGQKTRVVRL